MQEEQARSVYLAKTGYFVWFITCLGVQKEHCLVGAITSAAFPIVVFVFPFLLLFFCFACVCAFYSRGFIFYFPEICSLFIATIVVIIVISCFIIHINIILLIGIIIHYLHHLQSSSSSSVTSHPNPRQSPSLYPLPLPFHFSLPFHFFSSSRYYVSLVFCKNVWKIYGSFIAVTYQFHSYIQSSN